MVEECGVLQAECSSPRQTGAKREQRNILESGWQRSLSSGSHELDCWITSDIVSAPRREEPSEISNFDRVARMRFSDTVETGNTVATCNLFQRKMTTGPVDRMSHRKRRETKQQQSRDRSGNQISCCLVSFHVLCDLLSAGPVYANLFNN